MQEGAIALVVARAPVTQRPEVQFPLRTERLVEIYFSPFNTGDCVSLVARMTTYMGCPGFSNSAVDCRFSTPVAAAVDGNLSKVVEKNV